MNIAFLTKRQALNAKIKEMEKELEEMDKEIKESVGLGNEMIIGQYTIRYKEQTRKDVDKKKLQALFPQAYAETEREITFPRLTIT